LARTGATQAANGILSGLLRAGHSDGQTLGLLARTHKDLGLRASDPDERRRNLSQARKLYTRAYEIAADLWPGVNAATLALLMDDRSGAIAMAEQVRSKALERWETVDRNSEDAYWIEATLGELSIIRGRIGEARERYRAAAGLAPGWGHMATTRRNARILLRHLGHDPRGLDRYFRVPVVVVFAGHMIDRPGRREPRFPPAREAVVRAEIRKRLYRFGNVIGYAAAAAGADILFHEVIRDLGGESNVVLPCSEAEFRRESVDVSGDGDWPARFDRVLAAAKEVTVASEQKGQVHFLSYDYANLFEEGLAILRAGEFESDLIRMVVWDGRPGDGPGGTASIAQRWMTNGYKLERIPPGLEAAPVPLASRGILPATPATGGNVRLVSIIFADALHFSAVAEPQIPAFVDHFLGAIAKVIGEGGNPPLVKNTWGDGLYVVYEKPRDAGEVALALAETIASEDWTSHGLPPAITLRIALHAGPAYGCVDPVTGLTTFFGAHVSRAARIEPITPPGLVYASQAFAALAAAEQVRGFVFEYVGRVPLAKAAGTMAMYSLSRSGLD
jgi:class 3 adenylate cyclase